MTIPIRNIYYLLLYAWDALDTADLVKVGESSSPKVLDLLASVIDAGARHALSHGLDRGYRERTEQIAGIRGRMLLGQSVRTLALQRGQAICEIDELTHDVLHNRIVYTTLRSLRRTEGLDPDIRGRIDDTIRRMPHITEVTLTSRVFARVRLHRNNRVYAMLLDACRLAHRCLLPVEGMHTYWFRDFTRSRRQMHRLFERFLLGFYRREQRAFSVRRAHMQWDPVECSEHDRAFLPRMETDLTLESGARRIIIDAKFYREPLASSAYGKPTVRSGHLRQIYSYLRNSELTANDGIVPEGIMLYAGGETPVDLRYRIHGYSVRFLTVNLKAEWPEIRDELLSALIGVAVSGSQTT